MGTRTEKKAASEPGVLIPKAACLALPVLLATKNSKPHPGHRANTGNQPLSAIL
jgi:hypothetical protein